MAYASQIVSRVVASAVRRPRAEDERRGRVPCGGHAAKKVTGGMEEAATGGLLHGVAGCQVLRSLNCALMNGKRILLREPKCACVIKASAIVLVGLRSHYAHTRKASNIVQRPTASGDDGARAAVYYETTQHGPGSNGVPQWQAGGHVRGRFVHRSPVRRSVLLLCSKSPSRQLK